MRATWIMVPLAIMGLGGCAAALSEQGVAQLKAECAAKGMQFVQTGSRQTDLLVVAQSKVSGECVGPGDPRYIQY